MGSKTGIEYVDATWNPWSGCTPVSPGCANCYAKRIATRFGRDFSKVTCAPGPRFYEPTHWQKSKRILTCSTGDFFHADADEWRDLAWEVINAAHHHTYLVLTKRPERIPEHIPLRRELQWMDVWFGVTVENKTEKRRIDALRKVAAIPRWLSIEPLLEDLGDLNLDGISWVVCGGESGPSARPMNPKWARSIRDQCKAAGVPFFMKQMSKRELAPKDLQIKEYPE
jgi:protein gp37